MPLKDPLTVGPSAPRLASSAAEAVRHLDHVTALGAGRQAGYVDPAGLDLALAELSSLASRLPQTFVQAAQWLTRQHQDGAVDHDDPRALVGYAVAEVAAELADAIDAAVDLARALERARTHTAHLLIRSLDDDFGGPGDSDDEAATNAGRR